MSHRTLASLSSLLALAVLALSQPVLAAGPASPPTPDEAVRRACEAAGGLDAFRQLGVLQVAVNREEVTQDGHTSQSRFVSTFATPGPLPGHLDLPDNQVVAGDDGSGGWAVVQGEPDQRPSTNFMVKRWLTSNLFPELLPFSLTWDGVTVTGVTPAEVAGRPVWRLGVTLAQNFFHSPQISTSWTVDLDRATFALVRADSPFTDLGKGMTADGMRFYWGQPVKVRTVLLHGLQRVIGLDEFGREKSHSRVDHLTFRLLPGDQTAALFSNPIPPDKRPKPPGMQPPTPH